MPKFNFIVRYCDSIYRMKEFYEMFEMVFTEESHDGLTHYSTKLGDTIFELYPRPRDFSDLNTGINSMFGIKVEDIEQIKNTLDNNRVIYAGNEIIKVRDPEGGILLIEETDAEF